MNRGWVAILFIVWTRLVAAHPYTLSTEESSTCTAVYAGSVVKLQMYAVATLPAMTSILVYSLEDEKHFLNSDTQRVVLNGPPLGTFVVQDSDPFKHKFLNIGVQFNSTHEVELWRKAFRFGSTGLYCVKVETNALHDMSPVPFVMEASFEALYGKLPADEYPKLGLFLGLSIVYLIFGIIWTVRTWTFYHDVLQLQHYISAVTFFMMIETAINYAYYEEYNITGEPSMLLLLFAVVFNAARNSVSFFMLLIVSLGYGVVKPTLGSKMIKCVHLTFFHFMAGALYGVGSLYDDISPMFAIGISLPLTLAITAFYCSIFQSLSETIKRLEERQQSAKLLMYTRLWLILVASIACLVVFFVINTLATKHQFEIEWVQTYWQYHWILEDGFLHILFLLTFISIAILWRPTENNHRYVLEQVPGTDSDEEDLEALAADAGVSTTVTILKKRKLQVRGVRSDDTLASATDEKEDEEELMRWAEENGGDAVVAPAVTENHQTDT
ncbi:hypothetical protein HDU79_002080 [Rhizoclosmatium sp. JEL0117]|nr:hypothetical protein HDU79_002080 [Rhizoclosmatium sp. JEL0117]